MDEETIKKLNKVAEALVTDAQQVEANMIGMMMEKGATVDKAGPAARVQVWPPVLLALGTWRLADTTSGVVDGAMALAMPHLLTAGKTVGEIKQAALDASDAMVRTADAAEAMVFDGEEEDESADE